MLKLTKNLLIKWNLFLSSKNTCFNPDNNTIFYIFYFFYYFFFIKISFFNKDKN